MSNQNSNLQNIFSNNKQSDMDHNLKVYAFESFAKEVDYDIENELMKRLILDHSAIAGRLEVLYKELKRSESMLVEAQKIAMIGRWDVYISGEAIWSESMYDILEVDHEESEFSDLLLAHVHPDDFDNIFHLFKQMFQIYEPWALRYRLLMDDGRIKWVNIRFNSTIDSNDNIIHCYGTIQDITEMKKVEDELEKYSQNLEQLVEEKVQEISDSQIATIYALIKLSESRDDDTGAHIERTATFCRMLAEKARYLPEYSDEIDDSFIMTIYKASPLHDIGKVGIADSILLKPGKLTDEEFNIMKSHVQIGYDTLAKVGQQYNRNDFLKMGTDIALFHHEKWNGSGYNEGLVGTDIPLSARIMAVSDVYDALRSKRVYKEAFSHEKSMEIIISGKGIHFDPVLIDVFVQNQEEFRLVYESQI